MEINFILLAAGMVLVLWATVHLLIHINSKHGNKRKIYWIWLILLVPIAGPIAYLTSQSKVTLYWAQIASPLAIAAAITIVCAC